MKLRPTVVMTNLSHKERERFEGWILPGKENGCDRWIGGKNKGGYGTFKHKGRKITAHRIAFFLHYGYDPINLVVMHSCDNPWCVNPLHLSAGTQEDNSRDREEKGRGHNRSGEAHGRSKLTEREVIEIRELFGMSSYTKMELAKLFGVYHTLISKIVNRKIWKHI